MQNASTPTATCMLSYPGYFQPYLASPTCSCSPPTLAATCIHLLLTIFGVLSVPVPPPLHLHRPLCCLSFGSWSVVAKIAHPRGLQSKLSSDFNNFPIALKPGSVAFTDALQASIPANLLGVGQVKDAGRKASSHKVAVPSSYAL